MVSSSRLSRRWLCRGIVGFALVSKGPSSVLWFETTDTGIRIGGIVAIVLSWLISPICSGIIAALFFLIVRTFVMRSSNAYQRVFIFFPILVFFTIWINLFYVLDKGISKCAAPLHLEVILSSPYKMC